MKNRNLFTAVLLCGIMTLNCLCASDIYGSFSLTDRVYSPETRALSSNTTSGVAIEQTQADIKVIPDKYNTGASGSLTTLEMTDKIGNIQFVAGSNATVTVLDFAYRNKDATGTITFKNLDFSNHKFAIYNSDKINKKIKLVFNNCKFSSASVGKKDDNITCEFNNCTIYSFAGSNAVFNRCKFGQTYSDGIVPFKNVHINDCFFFDMTTMPAYDKERHIDGTQIYGLAEVDATNISYNNCRFEVPSITPEGSMAYVNACIMLQMEYSNADGISFTDCIVNGGGYSVYARSKTENFSLANIRFDGLKIGCSKKFGAFYTRSSPGIAYDNISETDSLYIGSVWKENGKTYLSVTNDTNQERTLTVHANTGTYKYTIPPCPDGSELNSSMTYSQMPFDIKIEINADCDNVVCFDTTTSGVSKQIRFVNWKSGNVYLDRQTAQELLTQKIEIITSGKCGDDVEYTLTNTGVLTLTGSGATYDYHSGKPAPWSEYSDYVKTIKIESGITDLGNQLFTTCAAATEVYLPDTLEYIGGRTFGKCVLITEIVLPASIKSIGTAAFSTVILTEAVYKGTDMSQIEIASQNDKLVTMLSYAAPEEEEEETTTSAPPVTTTSTNPQSQTSYRPTNTSKPQTQTSAATSRTSVTVPTTAVVTSDNQTVNSTDSAATKAPAASSENTSRLTDRTQSTNRPQAMENTASAVSTTLRPTTQGSTVKTQETSRTADNSSAPESAEDNNSADITTDNTDSRSPDTQGTDASANVSDSDSQSVSETQSEQNSPSSTQSGEKETYGAATSEMTENNSFVITVIILAAVLVCVTVCIILFRIKSR